MRIKTLLNNILMLFYPNLCIVCQENLAEGEKYFCLHCLLKLPVTNHQYCTENQSTERFEGKIAFEKATSFLFYNKRGISHNIVAEIKYKGNQAFGIWMGNYLATNLISSGFFEGIDLLVPIPLHKKKLKKRGFNQAELLARGISQIANIPLDTTGLYRYVANPTQTKKGSYERWLNTANIFSLRENHNFNEKHILLIDDVLTTGSTIEAAVKPIQTCKNVKISILTLAIAQ